MRIRVFNGDNEEHIDVYAPRDKVIGSLNEIIRRNNLDVPEVEPVEDIAAFLEEKGYLVRKEGAEEGFAYIADAYLDLYCNEVTYISTGLSKQQLASIIRRNGWMDDCGEKQRERIYSFAKDGCCIEELAKAIWMCSSNVEEDEIIRELYAAATL